VTYKHFGLRFELSYNVLCIVLFAVEGVIDWSTHFVDCDWVKVIMSELNTKKSLNRFISSRSNIIILNGQKLNPVARNINSSADKLDSADLHYTRCLVCMMLFYPKNVEAKSTGCLLRFWKATLAQGKRFSQKCIQL